MLPKFKHPDEIRLQLSQLEARRTQAHENLSRFSELTTTEKRRMGDDLHLGRPIFDLRRELKEMEFLKSLLECFDLYSKVYIHKWERDCDCVEFSMAYEFASSEEAWEFIQNSYEGAEGPVAFDVISQEDYVSFEYSERDRVLEAFEHGNTFNV